LDSTLNRRHRQVGFAHSTLNPIGIERHELCSGLAETVSAG
jgi:hypothetical protein